MGIYFLFVTKIALLFAISPFIILGLKAIGIHLPDGEVFNSNHRIIVLILTLLIFALDWKRYGRLEFRKKLEEKYYRKTYAPIWLLFSIPIILFLVGILLSTLFAEKVTFMGDVIKGG